MKYVICWAFIVLAIAALADGNMQAAIGFVIGAVVFHPVP